MRSLGVCVISYETRDLLRQCLSSAAAERPDEVIVVDNASSDGSPEMVAAEFPGVRLLRSEDNVGYGAAANLAVGASTADDILLLNADTVVRPGALRALSRQLGAGTSPLIVGPRISNTDGSHQTSCFHLPTPLHVFLYLSGIYRWIPRVPLLRRRSLQDLRTSSVTPVPWVLGAALAFRRDTFLRLGGFDESFFMYFEEVDLCRRVHEAGGQVLFVPDAEIVHTGGASTRRRPVEMRLRYFSSLARFYRKHYPSSALVRLRLVVTPLAGLRWAAGVVRWPFAGAGRRDLENDLAIQRSLVTGEWLRPDDRRRVASAEAPA